uniref:Uncharacterized protein n=1 Tax=Haptolina brevifila TaxID=156173 RepID=A0A7S2CNL0_9EUKA|mmetsp:Transcript_26878/g.54005  ORF Transcript_26878/g.54005 Transcript_26878/m.54005 type:complete len:246 (+) Transcript_26878:49-786(+)
MHQSLCLVCAPAITRLDLMSLGWRHGEVIAFAAVLPRFERCASVLLGGNQLGEQGAAAIAAVLRGNGALALTRLSIESSGLGDCGLALIASALEQNDTLTELTLDQNECGPLSSAALAAALRCNVSLATLSLKHCSVGSEGGVLLAEGLEENVTLRALLLSDNQIGNEGGLAFSSALELNQTLTKLWVERNGMSDTSKAALSEACLTHDPAALYGKRTGATYTSASRQLYQVKYGLRTMPVELLC